MKKATMSAIFVTHAADVLGDTERGLSGQEIIRVTRGYALDFNVDLPHPSYPFDAPNKRTALSDNLLAFGDQQKFVIIADLCDRLSGNPRDHGAARGLKNQLIANYGHLATNGDSQEQELIAETRPWLGAYPKVLQLFDQAVEKRSNQSYSRNVLDDLRLALEFLLKEVLANDKPLEKQQASLGALVKRAGGSKEFCNMFLTLVDYLGKYHNAHVKHSDDVVEEEVGFIVELTAAFMRMIVQLGSLSDR